MQINTDVYPEVGYDAFKRWSNEVTDYDPSEEIEHSIFYAGIISDNVQFCDETYYNAVVTPPNGIFSFNARTGVKSDVYFSTSATRLFNFHGSWETRNDNVPLIVTSFDVSRFYFDLDQITCYLYDVSNPDGAHALGSSISMSFTDYRNQSEEYKSKHLIRFLDYNMVTSGSNSLCKYKDEEDYTNVGVVPMIRYKFNDDTTIFTAVNLGSYGVPTWAGPNRMNYDAYSGNFPAMAADIYSNAILNNGKWFPEFIPGSNARLVTGANIGNIDGLAVNAVGGQVNDGYQMGSGIDTDSFCVPLLRWINSNYTKELHPFFTDEFVMRYFASFGLRFKVDDVMYVGYMDSQGCCNGDYIMESELADSDSANKDITDFTGSAYDADKPYIPPVPPGDDEDNTDPVSTTGAPFGTGLAHYYVTTVDSAVLGQISEALGTWDIDNTKKDLYRNLISCKILKPPAGIPSTPSTFEIYGVKPQYNGADITIPAVNGNPDITFGPYSISRKFNDFRDYAPYTRAEIFLPYCGWCALPSHVVGRSVTVRYFTDVIAGTVKAVVFCEANPVAEAAGMMAYDIPFAAQNVGAKIQAANTGMLAYGKAALQLSAGIGQAVATKGKQGISSIVNGAFGVAAGYNQLSMAANENYTEISGKSGDGCALSGIDTIIIKIVRPKCGPNKTAPYVPDGFAHTVGFLSMKRAKVSAASGLILCDNADTSGIGKATDAERAEIKRVLETGLYVNNPPE